ncbi:MAG: ATP-binding cassette domain-containing protein [Hydrogenophaga sp.]|uniref:sugar ABC transporter ATP-binding protein n=1 Tax=Hydrogenophaga sp. TaxID=1904254 RepID=UPI00169BCC91|nr:sugar ABC transporter ATP-binding protein [Hydrogenophaga sp.]NIM41032.1 ATP-binding cassette domain-containing protein [Hydrogenophaga sp.]NIN26390.1 ATP-binding cassette domain-containing protein [Hydrogenophaga sp.]NIN31265.1 ATP-binding cassette domain-containing protein [Hydrogenophaga sp.]NIN55304.1 ATP-binding cassette domain-containing protein [Hydrogenophaga sp.]NIO53688.1 ATP-binding cassette domain-containing protein [Hydrogenophaga sp.]
MSLHVRFDGVCKHFGPVQVLHGVSFELEPGRVYGLLGENGAGKSTLMKILCGYEQAGPGGFSIDGRPCRFADSREAEAAGVVLIHQEFNLADDLSVVQNIFLGRERRRGWLLDEASMRESAREALDAVGLSIDPDTRVRDLIVAEKQLVEIARALSRQARLLVMDEPTATLTPGETHRLFALIRQLRAQGVTVIYISHKLDEVEQITDQIVVMRDGRFVTRGPTASHSRQDMANLMVGRELTDMFPPKAPLPDAPPLLSVRGLGVPGWAQDVDFELRPGEILGFAGLVGAGRTELFEGLLGLRPRAGGEVRLQGEPVSFRDPRAAARAGLTYLSEDRKGRGLHVGLSLQDNLTLMDLDRHARPWLDATSQRAALQEAVRDFRIRAGSLDARAGSLSGGNQQKLAIAKVLQPRPRVLVLDEPTRGVDVGAKRDIYFLIERLAADGLGVIVISSELVELIGLCQRVIVMRAGRVQATLADDHLNEEELIAHATGTH